MIQRVKIFGWARGLRVDQLKVECDRNPARDFVLHGEEISHIAVEALGPEMGVGLGVDQLGVEREPARPEACKAPSMMCQRP